MPVWVGDVGRVAGVVIADRVVGVVGLVVDRAREPAAGWDSWGAEPAKFGRAAR